MGISGGPRFPRWDNLRVLAPDLDATIGAMDDRGIACSRSLGRGPRGDNPVARARVQPVCVIREVTDQGRVRHQLNRAIQERRRREALPDPAMRRVLREHAGVSQEILADAIGVSRPSVSRYESGSSTPRGSVLHRYLNVLDLLAVETAGDHDVPDAAVGRRPAETARECRHGEG